MLPLFFWLPEGPCNHTIRSYGWKEALFGLQTLIQIEPPSANSLPTFVELPPFSRWRQDYLTDEDYRALQNLLLKQAI